MSLGKYFIGGLSRDTTSDSLRAYFEAIGELSDAVVMTKDGRSRGFGFVTFVDPMAIPMNFLSVPHVLDGKQVDVKPAIPEKEMQASVGVKKLFIGGLTATTTKEHLEQHFGQFGALTDAVVMTTNGRPRGFGFVTFENEEQAEMAFNYAPGHLIEGKMVDVKKAEPKGSPNLTQKCPIPSRDASHGYYADSSQTHEEFLPHQQLYPMPPMHSDATRLAMQRAATRDWEHMDHNMVGTKIFVGGLAYHSTEDSLYAHFSLYGNVMGCEVMRRDGIPRGFGFVVFSDSSEAIAALAQPVHVIDGKQVECKTCQPKVPDRRQGYTPHAIWPQLPPRSLFS